LTRRLAPVVAACALTLPFLTSVHAHSGGDPYADAVIDYDLGDGGAKGYEDHTTVIGEPARFTGEDFGFPSVVSPFSGPFEPDEIVSIGTGGWIIIAFDEPVENDPANPHGIDLLVFGNSFFIDEDWPNGIVGGLFGPDGGVIDVSANGSDWVTIEGIDADGMFPTAGYSDAGPYAAERGSVETDFTKPVNPKFTLDDFLGLTHAQVLEIYNGSGGGAGIDIASTGLPSISFVRVRNDGEFNVEIDAFADVAPRISTEVVCADSAEVERGLEVGGSLEDLCDSDDADWSFRPDVLAATVTAPIAIAFDGFTGDREEVDAVRFLVEVAASETGVVQRIEMFNFKQGVYAGAVFPNIDTSDRTFQFTQDQSPEDFIDLDGTMRSRVSYTRPEGVPPFWTVGIDRVNWEVVR